MTAAQAATAKLEQARDNAQAARIRLQSAPLNSGAWFDARASLMFWEARAAVHAAGGFACAAVDAISQRRGHA
jgi:hypothetical protein